MIFSQKIRDVFSFDFPRTFDGFHHFHLRKRESELKRKVTKYIDKTVFVVGVLFPLMTLPQVWEIFASQNASGVSLVMWISGTLGSLYWLLYGILHKYTPIVISSVMWTVINILVIVGILLYA